MSQLKVNSIVPAGGIPAGASGGGIIQCVQVVKSDTFSVTGPTLTDVTGFASTITPRSANNKILVLIDVKIGSYPDYGVQQRITRNGTAIYVGDAAGNRPRLSNYTTTYIGASSPTYGYSMISQIISYLDSPASTSALTYKLQLASYSTNTAYVNRSHNWQNTTEYDGAVPSSITLMEVSG